MQEKGVALEVSNWIWHNWIPKEISICMWKAFYRFLPFDDKLWKLVFLLYPLVTVVSREKKKTWTMCWVLGTFACSLWRWATVTMGMFNVDLEPWKVKILRWLRCAHKGLLTGVLVGVLLVLITWKQWMRWCKARVEDIREDIQVYGALLVSRWPKLWTFFNV